MPSTRPGYFIVFEGPDGSGKTTVSREVGKRFAKSFGDRFVATREPGGLNVPLAETIRKLVLVSVRDHVASPRAEALLFCAARAEHVDKLVAPALAAGKLVVSDRYSASLVAYQGAARGLGEQKVKELSDFASGGLAPDLTVYLDIDYATSQRRKAISPEESNTLDLEPEEFFEKVRASYARSVKALGDKVVSFDGSLPVNELVDAVEKVILQRLEKAQWLR